MLIQEIPFQITLERDPNRSYDKIHQSELVRDIALKMNYLAKEYATEEIEDFTKVAAGLAWEEWAVQKFHPEIYYHPGEYELDGIVVTPDGVSHAERPPTNIEMPILHEFKFTWKSPPVDRNTGSILLDQFATHDKWWMWRTQMQAGCKVLETRFAMLHVYFANGDYGWMRKSAVPVNTCYKVFRFDFHQYEVDEAWNMLVTHKKEREKRGKK